MPVLDIVLYPDPKLREVCAPVDTVTDEIRKLLSDMAETMYEAPGIGLAAPQVGVLKRVIVVDVTDAEDPAAARNLRKLVNPEIIEARGETVYEEGCLSIPSVRESVKRFSSLTLKAWEENWIEISFEADGLLAICLQHEIDHLNGILFIDHLSYLKQQMLKGKLKRLVQEK